MRRASSDEVRVNAIRQRTLRSMCTFPYNGPPNETNAHLVVDGAVNGMAADVGSHRVVGGA